MGIKKLSGCLEKNQLLVNVQFSGVNRADLSQKAGKYNAPAEHSQALGLEVFGKVVACGSEVQGFAVGDEVFALVNGGGYESLCIVEADLALQKPDFLSPEQCASIPEAFLTAISNLFVLGKLQQGQTVLLHAAASGVGLAAIQLAKLKGAKVVATVRQVAKQDICRQLGADIVLVQNPTQKVDFAQQLQQLGVAVDLALDPAGGEYINQDLQCLKVGGMLINIGLMAGSDINIDLSLLLRKNLTVVGSTLRNKSNATKAMLTAILRDEVLPAIESGKIKLFIDEIFTINEVDLAHDYLKANANIGKVLLQHKN